MLNIMKTINLILLSVFFISTVKAQSIDLYQFYKSPFLIKFDNTKSRMEKSVTDFKAIAHLYSENEIALIRDSYDAAIDIYNNMLSEIVSCFADRRKYSFARKYPESYAKIVFSDFYKAWILSSEGYLYTRTDLTEGVMPGWRYWIYDYSFFQRFLKDIQLAFTGIQEIQYRAMKGDRDVLTCFLLEEYHFRLWDDL